MMFRWPFKFLAASHESHLIENIKYLTNARLMLYDLLMLSQKVFDKTTKTKITKQTKTKLKSLNNLEKLVYLSASLSELRNSCDDNRFTSDSFALRSFHDLDRK